MAKQSNKFKTFLKSFPEVALPITLGENTHMEFSKRNEPIPGALIHEYIQNFEKLPSDDLTEYVACFRIAKLKDFQAVVYWRAGLMDYRYVLATYNKNGEQIDSRVIAGMYSDGDKVTQSVATFGEDWSISIATGQSDAFSGEYDVNANTVFALELMPDGTIENE